LFLDAILVEHACVPFVSEDVSGVVVVALDDVDCIIEPGSLLCDVSNESFNCFLIAGLPIVMRLFGGFVSCVRLSGGIDRAVPHN
jgi:hypothetical protein